jgi:hypothetical protein
MKRYKKQVFQESNIYTLYWKTIKDKSWNKGVSMGDGNTLKKDAWKYKSQIAEDNNIFSGSILLLITKDNKIIWYDMNYSDEQIERFPDIKQWVNTQLRYF